VSTPELNLACAEGDQHALIAELQRTATFPGAADVISIDGLRVEYADGFGLARASNTTPTVVLRFEADDAAAMARIQDEFRRVLSAIRPETALDSVRVEPTFDLTEVDSNLAFVTSQSYPWNDVANRIGRTFLGKLIVELLDAERETTVNADNLLIRQEHGLRD